MSTLDPATEREALRLLRDVLDADAPTRETRLADVEPTLAARVRALLAHADADAATDALDAPTGDDDVAGLRIGPYRVIERIGHGGMGEVFRAARDDGAFDRDVALKRIWGGFAPLTGRFLRERQVLARLQHPGIAQLFDGGVTDGGQPWFAMELVRGEPITRWCDARRAGLEQRVDLVREVCAAVDVAHRALIVHRDLKPANVLVGEDGRAKLLDFGIAKLLDEVDAEQTQTLAMTPAWAAPEQRDGRPVTTASDVYQLGMLLRVLLADDLPAVGRPAARMAAAFDACRRTAPERAAA
ncbi:serine/threonine-protein kinase, partial [Lysobacter humi (ex Lee et al. 2017)]